MKKPGAPRPRRCVHQLAKAAAAILLLASTAFAQSPVLWTNVSGDHLWETPANWLPMTVPNSFETDTHIAAASPVILSSAVQLGNLSLTAKQSLSLLAGAHLQLGRMPSGGISNDGLITVAKNGLLSVNSPTLIEGDGRIEARGDGLGQFEGGQLFFPYLVEHAASHTIGGRGAILLSDAPFYNYGVVVADVPDRQLVIRRNAATIFNLGTFGAAHGGTLWLDNVVLDQKGGGVVWAAGAGSVIRQGYLSGSAVIRGSSFNTTGGGVIHAYQGRWENITNYGDIEVHPVNSGAPNNIKVSGDLVNHGRIVVNPQMISGHNGIEFEGSAHLQGTGELRLRSTPQFNGATIRAQQLTFRNARSHSIRGSGEIDVFGGTFINDGTITADVNGNGIGIRAAQSFNNGVLSAENGGLVGTEGPLNQTGGGILFANGAGSRVILHGGSIPTTPVVIGGTLATSNGGYAQITAPIVLRQLTAAADLHVYSSTTLDDIRNDGVIATVSASLHLVNQLRGSGKIALMNGLSILGGGTAVQMPGHTIEGPGFVNPGIGGALTNRGTLSAGIGGELRIDGELQLRPTSTLSVQLGGATYPAYSRLHRAAATPLTLNGELAVTLVNGYLPQSSDSFLVVLTQTTLAGEFLNVPSGARLNTTDGSGSFVVTYAGSSTVTLSQFGPPLPTVQFLNAASRKTHGAAGEFDIPLPTTGDFAIECRSTGTEGEHTIVFTFGSAIQSVGNVSIVEGTGSISSSAVAPDGHRYLVHLTSVTNAQLVTVRLANVVDQAGATRSNATATATFLRGDVNANGSVTASDIGLVKNAAGQPVSAANFRAELNANGAINASDISIVKSSSGSVLP